MTFFGSKNIFGDFFWTKIFFLTQNRKFRFSEHARNRAGMMLFEPDGMFGGKITQKMRFLAGIRRTVGRVAILWARFGQDWRTSFGQKPAKYPIF